MTAKRPTVAQKRLWTKVVSLGCAVGPLGCSGRVTIHHCYTGGGGRKDHSAVLGLCWEHHVGKEGIDGKRMSKRAWQVKYGSERYLIAKTTSRFTYDTPF